MLLCVYSLVAQTVKNLPASVGDAEDLGSISGSGRSLGEGNGYPLQYSCLENSMDRDGLQFWDREELDKTQLSNFFTFLF